MKEDKLSLVDGTMAGRTRAREDHSLWVPSAQGDSSAFEGEALLDCIKNKALNYAFEHEFVAPFRIRLEGPDQALVMDVNIASWNCQVFEKFIVERPDLLGWPLSYRLTDRQQGRSYTCVVSRQEARQWADESEAHLSNKDFAPFIPEYLKHADFSPEIYSMLVSMITEPVTQSLEAPFMVQLWDAHDLLTMSEEIEIDAAGEYLGGLAMAYCAHLHFPITVKFVDGKGSEIVRLVERLH
jgi:hypothetical protein